jgi:hypothetical protein
VSTDRRTACELARILDGESPGDGEALALARTLNRAADAARMPLSEAEIERALATIQPRLSTPDRRPRARGPRLAAGLALALAAVVAAILLASRLSNGPVVDVQARAISAIGRHAVLAVTEEVSAGSAAVTPSRRTGWFAPDGDARWTQTAGGRTVAETLVLHGRVTRYTPGSRSAVIAISCRALASACADAVDPVADYRRALLASPPGELSVSHQGADYLLTLPVQDVARARRVTQVVTLDSATFLPVRIVWQDDGRTVAAIRVEQISAVARGSVPAGTFTLDLPPSTRVREVSSVGPVRLLSARPISLDRARSLPPRALWLGPRFAGRALSHIELLRYTGGRAVRISYGRTSVWTYTRVVPPALLGDRLIPLKSAVLGGRLIRFYRSRRGLLVAEVDTAGATAAVVAPELAGTAIFEVAGRLRALR